MPLEREHCVLVALLLVQIFLPLCNARKASAENAYGIKSLKCGEGKEYYAFSIILSNYIHLNVFLNTSWYDKEFKLNQIFQMYTRPRWNVNTDARMSIIKDAQDLNVSRRKWARVDLVGHAVEHVSIIIIDGG